MHALELLEAHMAGVGPVILSCRLTPSLPLSWQGQYDIAKPEQSDPEDEEVLIANEAF